MARIRTIKPSFWSDARVVSLTLQQRLLAVALISYADDEGRFIAAISGISGYAFPQDDLPTVTVRKWRDAIAKTGLIRLYTVDGKEYGWFPNWSKHQVVNRAYPSELPPPPGGAPKPPPKRGRKAPDSVNGSLNGSVNDSRPAAGVAHESGRESFTTSEVEEKRDRQVVLPPTGGNAPAYAYTREGPLGDLISQVRTIRPRWSPQDVDNAARACADAGRSYDATLAALLTIAADPQSVWPSRVIGDGPWWRPPAERHTHSTTDERVGAGLALAAELRAEAQRADLRALPGGAA